jgi:Na+/H+ antiporter NhaD/arsenite permease-like protein
MAVVVIAVFIIGYILIALEHPIKINKTATALLTGVICWVLFVVSEPTSTLIESYHFQDFLDHMRRTVSDFASLSAGEIHREYVIDQLGGHLDQISQILFFLMGAMTIVELVDAHDGFRFVTDRIKTTDAKKLLWIVCFVTFFLSAVLDNLTTTIVLVSLIRKLIPDKEMRLFFAGMIIVAANAGGAPGRRARRAGTAG